jgi:hypothetical protein
LMVSCLPVHSHILFIYSTDMFINFDLGCSSRPVFWAHWVCSLLWVDHE